MTSGPSNRTGLCAGRAALVNNYCSVREVWQQGAAALAGLDQRNVVAAAVGAGLGEVDDEESVDGLPPGDRGDGEVDDSVVSSVSATVVLVVTSRRLVSLGDLNNATVAYVLSVPSRPSWVTPVPPRKAHTCNEEVP